MQYIKGETTVILDYGKEKEKREKYILYNIFISLVVGNIGKRNQFFYSHEKFLHTCFFVKSLKV